MISEGQSDTENGSNEAENSDLLFNNINVFTVHFDQLNISLLNKC